MRKLVFSLLILACILMLSAVSTADEYRAFWVDAWGAGVLSQTQVNKLLGTVGSATDIGDIREANCNSVIVQVRRNCDANYPSSMGEPYMSGLSPADFNSLQAVINAAHDTTGGKQRIDVHAWIVTFRTSGGLVYTQHDDTPTGSLTNLDNYWPTRTSAGAETSDKAFDPGHPLCEEYLTDVCMDIVNNFDVDGLNYDYIRFTANNQGYNPTSVNRYIAWYNENFDPDISSAPAYTNEQWKQWRRDQVTNLVRRVYAKIQASKPWVKQSGSTVTWNPSPPTSTRTAFQGTRPYYDVYSDWDAWQEEGIVDINVPMTYYNWASLPADYTNWINFLKDRKFNRHVAIGPGIYLNSLQNAINEILMTRTASPASNYANGFCGYSYRVPYSGGTWDVFSPQFTSQVTSAGPVPIPDMPWKSSPTKGHISGTVTYQTSGGAWADCATVSITGPENRTMLCDGTGFYAFIDLTPGVYTITASKTGHASDADSANVQLGVVTGNMYVRDLILDDSSTLNITNVQSTGVTNNSATITWTTNDPATSQVQYGLTSSYGSSSPLDSNLVTSHSVTLTGLTQNTTYHFRAVSTAGGDTAYSTDYTFTTLGPPVILTGPNSTTTATTATITWTTNLPTTGTVNYGLTSAYGNSGTDPNPSTTSHSVTLTGLAADTTYHYQAVSTNAYGSAQSTDLTFTTLPINPVISSVQSSGITTTGATITWTTDITSTSQVEYGLTTSYGSSSPLDSNLVTSHSVTLSGLAQSTTYHYRVRSTKGSGTATSGDYTFTTLGPPAISDVQATPSAESAVITWTTDAAANGSVNYGLTPAYGSQATDPNGSTTSHSVTVTGLTELTTYHYQCVSTNAYGTAQTTDATFTTTAVVSEIEIDNLDPGWANTSPGGATWSVGSNSLVPKIGTNYLYTAGSGSTSSVTRSCSWTPEITVAGLYDVYVYYQIGANRNSAAPYTTYYNGGQVTSIQNQYSSTPNQGGWFLVGQDLPFAAGTSGYVGLTNASTDTNYVSADAAKFVLKSVLDVTAPSVPTGLTANAVSGTQVNLSWTASTDNVGVTGYKVFRGGVQVGTSATASYSDATCSPVTTYSYEVSAYDAASNESAKSTSASATTPDDSAPVMTSVTDEKYTTSTTTLQASWAASEPESSIIRYEYAVGSYPDATDVKGWTDAGTSTSATISGMSLSVAGTYFISVRAVNADELTSDPMGSDGVTIAQPVTSIAAAKALADNWPIYLSARTITANFSDRLYIEEDDRFSAICLEYPSGIVAGTEAEVYGRLGVTDGERSLKSCKIIEGSTGTVIDPLFMLTTSLGGDALGGTGLNNLGLLVTIAGKVTEDETGYIYVDDGKGISDGSGLIGVRVDTTFLFVPPVKDQYVSATGICTLHNTGSAYVRLVRPRDDGDVTKY